jgi:heme/copper-type cytochrome/quinol oxidase subunit 2
MTPSLADAIFWVAVVCCVVAQIAILRSTFAVRAGGAVSPSRRPAGRVEEIIWAVVPALALAGVLALTWRAMHPRTLVLPAGSVETAATGEAGR